MFAARAVNLESQYLQLFFIISCLLLLLFFFLLTPISSWAKKTPIITVANSGAEDPAAINVAPATSGDNLNSRNKKINYFNYNYSNRFFLSVHSDAFFSKKYLRFTRGKEKFIKLEKIQLKSSIRKEKSSE